MTDPLDLPSEWSPVVLERVWGLIRNRLERNGIRPSGRLTVGHLDLAERQCVGELLGRAVETDRVSIDLEVLDRLVSGRDGMGLVTAVEEVLGEPLVARAPRPSARGSRPEDPSAAATEWLAAHPAVDWAWVDTWLERLGRDGMLLVETDPAVLVRRALEVLWHRRDALAGVVVQGGAGTSGASARPVALGRLAERVVHDAHALDPDRLLSLVVLRALAARTSLRGGTELPGGTGLSSGTEPLGSTGLSGNPLERRLLWETAGVVTDLVASTCLTWGLTGPGMPGADGGGLRPVHLTWWDLEAGAQVTAPRDILICDDPVVLEAVARAGIDIGAICTDGRPNLVASEVITRARSGGARLRYHGSFDWPGIALANDALGRHGAAPTLMGVEDYLTAPGSLPLRGILVEPAWDRQLGAAMVERGLTVHQESVLERLVDELLAL